MSGEIPLSVLIATRDRRELLRRCLLSLSRQTADPGTYEVLVADDGSTDGTAAMAEGLGTPFRLRILRLEPGGKAAALNAALEVAEGGTCLFLDDDLVAASGLIAEHAAAHREDEATLAIGRLIQVPPRRPDPYAAAHARAWNERYDQLAAGSADWADCYGANFSAPRPLLLEVGGFATDLPAVEDLDIGFRLSRAGCAVRYLPAAVAEHDDGKPGRRILADQVAFGSVAAGFSRGHPAMRPRLLGWFTDTTPREVIVRSLLIALRVPPLLLARAGRLVPGSGPRRVWFSFVSRYAFWRGARSAMSRSEWLATARGVPVLMYHAFGHEGEAGSRFVLPGRRFATQMRLLRLLRYRVIGLAQLSDALASGRPLPARAAVITIDDGYRDNLELAMPILSRHGFPATLFLVSRGLGGANEWDRDGEVAGRPLLSSGEARRMAAAGIEPGAHTRTHASLPGLPAEGLHDEVAGARSDLEAALGTAVRAFAYPYGRHDDASVEAVRRAGFTGACTAFARPARSGDDALLIPRIEIRGTDSARRFLRKLLFGDSA